MYIYSLSRIDLDSHKRSEDTQWRCVTDKVITIEQAYVVKTIQA